MALISLEDVSLSFGGTPLLDKISFQLEPGQRVCLLGRNGMGKTTLLKVISAELAPDAGAIMAQPDLQVARLPQDMPMDLHGSVFDVVAAQWGQLLTDYHHASQQVGCNNDAASTRALVAAQQRLEAADGWALQHRVEAVLTQMQLDPQAQVQTLSGGLKRRVLLAQALVRQPDILLLDEPTNHLDIESIRWLETFLKRFAGTLVFITHDRAFLRSLATRIVELDRGALFDWACDYDTFLKRKQQLLDDTVKQQQKFDRLLSQEEAWIRQGIKARRTRNEGRVRQLELMRSQRQQRRELPGQARMQVESSSSSGNLVVRCENACFSYGQTPVIKDLTTTIERGDRVGIIGVNGCGKTTLLNLLLGNLQPVSGSIQLGTRLQIAYFDQLRQALDQNATVFDNVNNGNDKVQINGNWRSVYSYLQDFLFTPERVRMPVSYLSGGERNRLLLAKLFTLPMNLLIMDEPTNDLDVETLELLEEKLLEFAGTVLLVSHDRQFLNNVVTCTLVFESDGVHEYPGDYDDYLRQRKPVLADEGKKPVVVARAELSRPSPRRLSYKDKRELEQLPGKIEQLEAQQAELCAQLADPQFYQSIGSSIATHKQRLSALEAQLEQAYSRWQELEALAE